MEALQAVAGQLGIDQTFYPLFGLILVLYLVLSQVYLRPFQHILHHRKEKTEGTKKEAQELVARAEEKLNQYKSRLKETNESARQIVKEAEDVAKKEEAKILSDAATRAKTSLQNIQKEIDREHKAALEGLSNEVPNIASEIATKVLGRPVGVR